MVYMFILGLLMGGNLLKSYISNKHHDFLTFSDSSLLSKQLKDFLNTYITKNEEDKFINIVKESYLIIFDLFDDYYKELYIINVY